jgi:hypothetical protein
MPEAASRSNAGVLNHLFGFPPSGGPAVQLIMPECCWSVMMKRIFGLATPASIIPAFGGFFPFGLSAADVTGLSISPIAADAVVVMNSRLFIIVSKG